jgi:hypothetical protein
MHTFTVAVRAKLQADTVEEAALLFYQQLVVGPPPLSFHVIDETNTTTEVMLDQSRADEFASIDHTADPGNW